MAQIHIEPRAWRDARDFEAMRLLLSLGRASDNGCYYVHPGDLNWWTHYPPNPARAAKHIRLWEEGERLLAWCLVEPSDASLDVYVLPGIFGTSLHGEIFAWSARWAEAEGRAAKAGTLSNIWVSEHDAITRALYAEHGFVDGADHDVHFERTLNDAVPASVLPDGFRITDARTEADFLFRAQATHGAFGPHRLWDAYWQKNLGFFHSAVYQGANNLVVVSPDKRGAAACVIWFDHHTRVGLFEPVGTHPDFQRRGLGKAVLYEGLRRMHAAGMTKAIVSTPAGNAPAIALYQSVGFVIVWAFFTPTKNL
jgi:mycothiol synthase